MTGVGHLSQGKKIGGSMKRFCLGIAIALVMLFAVTTFAASSSNFDGVYKFSWRSKGDVKDLEGWWGMMVVNNGTMSRFFHSADGKDTKYYVGNLTKQGDVYKLKFTYTYKPEYVGQEHDNKITFAGGKLVMESPDGGKTFKEVWEKK